MVFVAASALYALSDSLPELAAECVLQGLGGACIMGVNLALARFIYPSAQQGRGVALNGMVIATGVALSPSVAAAVLSVATWPFLFWINLPLGAVRAVARFQQPSRDAALRHRFDAASALLLVFALGPLVFGLDSLARGARLSSAAAFLSIGIACSVLLVRRERSRASPLFPVDLLGLGPFRTAFSAGFLGFIASNFFIVAMPFFSGRGLAQCGADGSADDALGDMCGTRLVSGRPHRRQRTAGPHLERGIAGCRLGFSPSLVDVDAPIDLGICARIGLAEFGFGLFQPPDNRAILLTAPLIRSGAASLVRAGAENGQDGQS